MTSLQTLSVFRNSFSGGFPEIYELQNLRTILAHDCGFTGQLPRLPHSAVTVLLHGNLFSGLFDNLGHDAKHIALLTALPGNNLLGPVHCHLIADAEATLQGKMTSQLLVNEHFKSSLAGSALTTLLALLLFIEARMWQRGGCSRGAAATAPPPQALSTLRYILEQCWFMLARHALVAFICTIVYNCCDKVSDNGQWLTQISAYYSRGTPMLVAYAIVLLSILMSVIGVQQLRGPRTLKGVLKGRGLKRSLTWTWVFIVTQLCNLPAVLNSFIDCVPLPAWLLWVLPFQKYLPAIGALSTLILLPHFLRRIAKLANVPVHRAWIFLGASSWLLPCLVVVVLSQDCNGAWWAFVPECTKPRGWDCRFAAWSGNIPACRSDSRFDVANIEFRFNGSAHLQDDFLISKEELCRQRWSNPSKCTSRVLDVVSGFLIVKLLVASILPPAFVAAVMLTPSEPAAESGSRAASCCSVAVARRLDPDDGVSKLVLLLRISWCCNRRSSNAPCELRLLRLGDKFSSLEVTRRVAIWTDLSLGWGLVCPPIAAAALLYVGIEMWAYNVIVNRLRLDVAAENDEDGAKFPSTVMLFWLLLSCILVSLHFGSTSSARPGIMSVLALAAMAASWVLGSWLYVRHVRAHFPNPAHRSTIELRSSVAFSRQHSWQADPHTLARPDSSSYMASVASARSPRA
eukprot:TRINITY_DN18155_c0_g1_i1.p1 TRINITY_DN18155_c0_g1~~TRINITY_DN18155_c0_g1_i1.p1  ORF type:complete len:686 (+),score=85.03 TRINITY_DN18155_c0_g1_i1:138-2195(+)